MNLEEKSKEQLQKEDIKRIEQLRLIDDDFMTVFFSDFTDGIELILRIILNKDQLIVKQSRTQHIIKNIHGRTIWLDIDAVDENDRRYNIEIQRTDKGAIPKRARYHSSMIDASVLSPGDNFELLPETYIIFITENDVLGENKSVYEINRTIKGSFNTFDDGAHIIYVNGKVKDDTALGKLMHDFYCTSPDDMYYNKLADRARFFKKSEGGRSKMCQILDDMRNEAVKARDREYARKLIVRGKDSIDEIADLTGLSVNEVEVIKVALTA